MQRLKAFFIAILFFSFIFVFISMTHHTHAGPLNETIIQELYERYEDYREPSLYHRRFKHEDILPLIKKAGEHPDIELIPEGFSVEGREIFRLKAGSGNISILLWSQMHGDEPTATMALFDLFNFLTAQDSFDPLRKKILEHVTIHAVPMLNPDGAQRYWRRTAFGIDMNRDALRLQSPESRILKRLQEETKADFGFNLHDQSIRYSAGDSPYNVIIAFLAPAFDAERSINPIRKRSMMLIAELNEMLQKFIPGHVATFSDEFEPRSFGDNMTKWGTSVVLVESGGKLGDPEKQYIRKLNFLIFLNSFLSIINNRYENFSVDQYNAIPDNRLRLHSALFQKVTLPFEGDSFTVDIAVNRSEVNINGATDFYYRGIISEIGDLSTLNAYEEQDGTGLVIKPGKVYPVPFSDEKELETIDPLSLIREGYIGVRLDSMPERNFTRFPLNIYGSERHPNKKFLPGKAAHFLLYRGEEVVHAVINGFIVDMDDPATGVPNALIYH